MLILRTVENEIYNGKFNAVNVYGVASSIIYLLNDKRAEIEFIEKKHAIKLNFFIDRDATSDSYSIEKIKVSDVNKATPTFAGPALQDTSDIYNESEVETNHKPQKRRIDKPQKNFNENKVVKETDKPINVAEKKETTEATQEIKAKRPSRNRKRITKKTNPNKEPNKDLKQEPNKPADANK